MREKGGRRRTCRPRINKAEVRAVSKRMKNGRKVGPDVELVEVLKCQGEKGVEYLTRSLNDILESERMEEEVYSHQFSCCGSYRGFGLIV